MSEVIEFTSLEIKLSRQGALSAARSARGLVPTEDLAQEAALWMIQNYDKVEHWRTQGRHGQNKLRNACRQRCLSVVARERKNRSGLKKGDTFFYSAQIIREVLPDIWDEDDWSSSGVSYSSDVKAPTRPSEGNNRLATIADIRAAFYSLKKTEQELLEALYRDGGIDVNVAALQYDVAPRTIKRREARYLDKMVEKLGGESPFLR